MTEATVLDLAHRLMEDAPEDAGARMRFYERLADTELFLLLLDEAEGDAPVRPQVFALDEGRFVLAFDTEERLATFAEAPTPYAAIPGRVVMAMLAQAGELGLGLNLAVAPSSFLMPAGAVSWLADMLAAAPEAASGLPKGFARPTALPPELEPALRAKLSQLAGFAETALLAAVTYADDRRGHMLAFLGAREGSEPALAKAVGEALAFSGIEAGEIDVSFLAPDSAAARTMDGVAIRLEIPQLAEAPAAKGPTAPGMDPGRPPILR
ncbi:SseB family protein [Frigidibacter sp. MR17.14]|uniref:SseB family protein n=1 Tax=Frigidibacter sp. MR17.14 TaxID=3126509 RepID=UPI003012F9C6